MQPTRICSLVFSPTGTTRRVTAAIAQALGGPFEEIDLTRAAAPAPHPAPSARTHGCRAGKRHAGRHRRCLRQPGIRKCGGRTRRLGRRTRIPPGCSSGIRRRTLLQFARRTHRRRTSRHAGPRRSGRFRNPHPRKTPARRSAGSRCQPPAHTPHPAALHAALHPLRTGLPAPAAPQSGRPHSGCRCRKMHPLRPVRIALPDAGHRPPRRCLRCCACVKGCPAGARSYDTPFAAALARNFARRKPPVTLL